jgi:DNA-binding transcriptional LysR family regulator
VELRQLRYFVTVAEERHFGRAAERLHLGQPAISQQIRRLERQLGVELLDRSPRHVRLTAAGERFLPAARAVLAAADRARAAVAGLTEDRAGVLRLGTSTGLGDHLERVLDALARHAPELTVELRSAPTATRLTQVADGTLDAAFVRGFDTPDHARPDDPAGSPAGHLAAGVRFVPVWRDPLLAAVPARHPLAAAAEVALADLARLPLRLTARRHHPTLVDLVLGACRDAGFEPVPGPVSENLPDTLASIGAGGGWTVVYASHAHQLSTARVAFRPFRAPGLALPTALAVHSTAPTPNLGVLLEACASDHHDQ